MPIKCPDAKLSPGLAAMHTPCLAYKPINLRATHPYLQQILQTFYGISWIKPKIRVYSLRNIPLIHFSLIVSYIFYFPFFKNNDPVPWHFAQYAIFLKIFFEIPILKKRKEKVLTVW